VIQPRSPPPSRRPKTPANNTADARDDRAEPRIQTFERVLTNVTATRRYPGRATAARRVDEDEPSGSSQGEPRRSSCHTSMPFGIILVDTDGGVMDCRSVSDSCSGSAAFQAPFVAAEVASGRELPVERPEGSEAVVTGL
jgi:hypothetical protein